MRKVSNSRLADARAKMRETFFQTVLSHEKAEFLTISQKSAMVGCLNEFVELVWNYIDKL